MWAEVCDLVDDVYTAAFFLLLFKSLKKKKKKQQKRLHFCFNVQSIYIFFKKSKRRRFTSKGKMGRDNQRNARAEHVTR
jgi:hypothetical protein